MKSIRYVMFALVAVFAAGTLVSTAHAWEPVFLLADNGKHQKQHYSLDRAVTKIRKRQKGRILSADTYHDGGRSEHRIRMLSPDGRVRTYRFDPRSGSDLD